MRHMVRWLRLFPLLLVVAAALYTLWYITAYYPRTEAQFRAHFIRPEELNAIPQRALTIDTNNSRQPSDCGPEQIPRILHQTYSSTTIPPHWQPAQQSCLNLHANWTYTFWTDAAALSFISEQYPWFLLTYTGYPRAIQRSDALRYFALYHYGGVYLDLDVGCKQPLEPLLAQDAVLPKTTPMGVSNDVMAATPRHPFFKQILEDLKGSSGWRLGWRGGYLDVLWSTGPMFLTGEVLKYWENEAERNTDERSICKKSRQIRILPPELYGSGRPSFFAHYQGSSWHGRDAEMVKWLAERKSAFLVWAALIVLIAAWLFLLRRRKRSVMSAMKAGTNYI